MKTPAAWIRIIVWGLAAVFASPLAAEGVPCFAQERLPDGRSEAPIDAWMEQAAATRADRVDRAFAASQRGFQHLLVRFFARFWTGDDLASANAELREILTSEDPEVRKRFALDDKWNLWYGPSLYRIWFNFSSAAEGPRAGRLAPETEAVILERLWELTEHKNDIALTRESTWWMTGSENHDLNSKVTSLLTSRIFAEHPDYRERLYPNLGDGAGRAYWFHSMYGNAADSGPPGGGDLTGGGEPLGPEVHYRAWVDFFKTYLRERARKGFFVEVASSGYMRFTISYLIDIRDYSGDATLSALADEFLDVVWADWAIDQLNGHRGGGATRWVDYPHPRGDAMYDGGRFLLGGYNPADAAHGWYGLLASDYALPRAVWALALRREAMGSFVFESRRPGEENPDVAWERPAGFERSLLLDTESRFLRYSYITSAFILGTQMDHPGALHSHLSPSNRWQGILFGDPTASRVYPSGFRESDQGDWKPDKAVYFRSVQHEGALVVQRSRNFLKADPEWFPVYDPPESSTGVSFGKLGASAVEADGWIFVGTEDAWLAVRPLAVDAAEWLPRLGEKPPERIVPEGETPLVYAAKEKCWEWTPDREAIILDDPLAPVLFQAGLRKDFPDLDAFRGHVLAGELSLRKVVVEGFFNISWKPEAPSPVWIEFPAANQQMPRIDGAYVNYAPEFLFRSPYLNARYGSGVITINQGDARLRIDFEKDMSKSKTTKHDHE